MSRISDRVSESLSEYVLLTDTVRCRPEDVSLETNLGHISLQYPYITARMQSVVGPEMAKTAGRNGILTMVPRSLPDEDKQKILDANKEAKLSKGEVEFQGDPEYVDPSETLEKVVERVERTGHSVMPVIDKYYELEGVYIHDPDHPPNVSPGAPITKAMTPLSDNDDGIHYLINNEYVGDIKDIVRNRDKKFVPIIDELGRLQKLAFEQKFDTNYIGIAISTSNEEKWKEEIEKWGPQVDTLCIDSSNACFEDAFKILKYGKERFPDKTFGIGNIIQGRHFRGFAEEGADYIIGGMGVGSICQTGAERGNGRGQMTVAFDLAEARDDFYEECGRYVPIVIDGGMRNKKDMNIALSLGDLIMMGGYFNQFFESAGPKLDDDNNYTDEEINATKVESWGEGHPRARLIAMYGLEGFRHAYMMGLEGESGERYGHATISGATVEGTVNRPSIRGRLKPCVEYDARYIRTNIANCGGWNLQSFRDSVKRNGLLEKASGQTLKDMLPHGGEVVETK